MKIRPVVAELFHANIGLDGQTGIKINNIEPKHNYLFHNEISYMFRLNI